MHCATAMEYKEERVIYTLKLRKLGLSTAEICQKMGICRQTFYHWKKKYAGMGIAELQRIIELKEENKRLKALLADLNFTREILPPA